MSDPKALDMTLDDLIKKNKPSRSGRRGGGVGARSARGGGVSATGPGGPTRRNFKRRGSRPAPYSAGKVQAPDGDWQHDMFADHAAAYPGQVGRASAIETGTKLYISNLEYGVSNEDIKELFSEVGDLKRFGVHYDRSGRSKGTADVVFSRRQDALAAVKRYNNVQLDGKPMKVEIVGTNISTQAAPVPAVNGNQNGVPRSGGRGRGLGRARGTGHGGRRGGGRGQGRGRGENVSAEDLDAELEKYHAESMQIN